MFRNLPNNRIYYKDPISGYWTIGTIHADFADGIIGGLANSEVYWKAKVGETIVYKFKECVKEYIEACNELGYEPESPEEYGGEF